MPVTPEYELSLRLDTLADIIAQCAVWQALCADANREWDDLKQAVSDEEGDATSARARITIRRKDESEVADADGETNFDAAFWPRIVLCELRDSATKMAAFSWDGTAEFEAHVEIPCPVAYQGLTDAAKQDAYTYQTNTMGWLRSQILLGSQGRMQFQQFGIDAIDECDPAEVNNNRILFCRFMITISTWETGA